MNEHYLYLADCINPDDFESVSFNSLFDFATPIEEIEILIYLANLRREENINERNRVVECFVGTEKIDTVREYADNVRRELTQQFGTAFANLILLDLEREISELYIDDAAEHLENSLTFACNRADDFFHLILEANQNKQIDTNRLSSLILNGNDQDLLKTGCYPLLGLSKKTGKPTYCYVHEITKIYDALRIFFVVALQQNTVISKCQKCGDFFSAASRCDQAYCDTCRKLSYDSRVKDETRKVYRKIYKMQHARLRRNKESKSKETQARLQKKFDFWSNESRIILEQCEKEKKITLQEMVEILSSDDWLRK